MMLRIRFGNWRFSIVLVPVIDVYGVNSKLADGKHILMWDYDEHTFETVLQDLQNTQNTYNLPNIYILQGSTSLKHHCYCFKRVTLKKAAEILAYTKYVDWRFLRFGMIRGEFTLRITPKFGSRPKLKYILTSATPEDCSLHDLKNFCKYDDVDYFKNLRLLIDIPPKRGEQL